MYSFIVLVILFIVCVYVITVRYFKYDTITNVSPILRQRDLPPIIESIRVTPEEEDWNKLMKSAKWKTFNRNLTLNGKIVKLDPPYIVNKTIYRDIVPMYQNTYRDIIFDQYYRMELSFQIYYETEFMKRLNGTSVEDMVIQDFNENTLTGKYIMYSITLLESPYDTNCFNYNGSKHDCMNECKNINSNSDYSDLCSEKCGKSVCNILLFRQSIIAQRYFDGKKRYVTVSFSEDMISLTSNPAFTPILFWQQIVGLVTMFFDLAILDILTPITIVSSYCYVAIKIKKIKKVLKSIKKNSYTLLDIFIFSLFLYHMHYYVDYYMRYETTSETYIGKINDNTIPNIRINPFRNVSYVNITIFGKFYATINLYNSSSVQIIEPKIEQPYLSAAPISISVQNYDTNRYSIDYGYIEVGIEFSLPVKKYQYQATSQYEAEYKYSSRLFEQTLLPAPFWSDCIDYDMSTEFNSSDHCFESCLASKSLSHDFAMTYNHTECYGICHWKNCYEKKIIVTNVAGVYMKHGHSMSIESWKESFTINLSQQQSRIDFITYTASLLGLWFGWSIMQIPEQIAHFKKLIFVRISIKVAVYICCLIQLYLVVESYSKYEIVSKVHIGIPTEYAIPSISILSEPCGTKPPQTTTLATIFYGFASDPANERFDYNANGSCPGIEFLPPIDFHMTYKIFYNISFIAIKDPKMKRLENITSPDQYLHYYGVKNQKLINITLHRIERNRYKYSGRSNGEPTLIQFNEDQYHVGSRMMIALHSDSYDIPISGFFRLKSSTYTLTYDMMRTFLLPSPYTSHCINYFEDLQAKCSMYLHLSRHGKHPNSIAIGISSNISRMKSDNRIVNECFKRYGKMQKCESVSYTASSNNRHYDSYSGEIVEITEPKEETSCQFSPKTMFYDLVILIADVIGLWLGISFGLMVNKISSARESFKTRNVEEFLVDRTLECTLDTSDAIPAKGSKLDL